MSHPPEEELLRYVDGELDSRGGRDIRKHLEACWQCRVALDELQKTVAECVRYRKNVLEQHLPPPPAPWPDIYRQFSEIDAERQEHGWRNKLSQVLQIRRWAPVAIAALIACALFYRFRQTPSVQAAELLRKAVAASDAYSGKPRHIQIRTKDRRMIRTAGLKSAPLVPGSDSGALLALQAKFVDAHYDWDDPLSAKAYLDWHDSLQQRQDRVTEARDSYLIQTNTESGELAQATLTIRAQDLRPVQERLEFRDRDWVEISEVADDGSPDSLTTGGPPAGNAANTSAASVPVNGNPSGSPAHAATLADELHAVAALQRVGADLGDPIDVSRSGSEILVTGVGIAPKRQQEIHDALSSQSRVEVRFMESPPPWVPTEPRRETPGSGSSAALEQLQARMAELVGGRAYFTQVAAQVLDLNDPMMSRAYALRRLSERFPVSSEAELIPPDRQLLRNMRQEHAAELRRQSAEIDRLLRPMLGQLTGAMAEAAPPVPEAAWQPATEELFQSARRVEKLLAVLFGFTGSTAAGEPPGDQLPRQLASSLAELRARLDAYDRVPERSGR
jgi:hypothetical protein